MSSANRFHQQAIDSDTNTESQLNKGGITMESNKVEGIVTPEEKYKKFVEEIQAMSGEQLVQYLGDKHRSDCHLIIRDMMTPQQNRDIRKSSNLELKKEFGIIKQESQKSWDHDHRMATMIDVDKACTQWYTIALKLMRASNDDIGAVLTKIMAGLDEVRAKLDMQPINWSNDVNNNEATDTTSIPEDDRNANSENE